MKASLTSHAPGNTHYARSGYANNLFVNDGAAHFTDQAAVAGVADIDGYGYAVIFCDADNDGANELCARTRAEFSV